MTFVISWGGIVAIVGPTNILAAPDVFLRMHWVPALVLGPSVSGVLLTVIVDGRRGIRDYGRRLRRWRVPVYWYAIALFLAPLYNLLTCFALSAWSPAFAPGFLAADDRAAFLVSGSIVALTAGVCEELGWTGFATPTLRRRHSALATGVIVGVLWGLWHVLPKLVGARAFDSVSVLPIELVAAIVGLTGYRVLMVWVYDRTQSLLVGIVMHTGLTASLMLVQPLVTGPSLAAVGVVQAIIPWLIVAGVLARTHSARGMLLLRS
jgi:membrane protease YdiL (CAAX protease family)